MTTWTNDIVLAMTNLGGMATLSEIYVEVAKIRTASNPISIQATIRGAIERNSSDSKAFSGSADLFFSAKGIGSGIWGLRSHNTPTPLANDISSLSSGTELPDRKISVTYRIIRETEMARKIKLIHKNKCQICGHSLKIAGRDYSEAHHLKPLGAPHFGPDTPANIIVACPNCHVLLDYFSFKIDTNDLRISKGHVIDQEYIDYHNQRATLAPQ